MLIDNIGASFFPNILIFRIIGRFSMPLFAFSLARGFFYSSQKGAINKYIKNILLFSIISQLLFLIYALYSGEFLLNIGFSWLFSILFLKHICLIKKSLDKNSIMSIILIFVILVLYVILLVDYNFYPCLLSYVFYIYIYEKRNYNIMFYI